MSTHDHSGIEYVKMSELKVGMSIYPDPGFGCLKRNQPCPVHKDHRGDWFVYCEDGQHSLEGQRSGENHDGDHLVGFYKTMVIEGRIVEVVTNEDMRLMVVGVMDAVWFKNNGQVQEASERAEKVVKLLQSTGILSDQWVRES